MGVVVSVCVVCVWVCECVGGVGGASGQVYGGNVSN